MNLDKKFETILRKKIELERLNVEDETVRNWQEKIRLSVGKSNDYKSLQINIKKALETMENRLRILQSAIRDLT